MIEFPITRGCWTKISNEDDDLALYSWCTTSNGYAHRRKDGKVQLLHRLILERMLGRTLGRHEYTDHINGDKLDNQRTNLRISNASLNSANRRPPKHNTCGYKGACYNKRTKRRLSYIGTLENRRYLGHYDTAEQAARRYDQEAIVMYGEHAQLNLPDGEN
jgi:hypothetical protein